MEITRREYKRVTVLRVTGRVDAKTAQQFEDALDADIKGGNLHLVLELDGTDYMSSAAVRALITAQKTLKPRGGSLILAQPSTQVRDVLRMAGLESLFPIFGDTVAAIGSV